jgi:membrane-associated phospholipid phosphatase
MTQTRLGVSLVLVIATPAFAAGQMPTPPPALASAVQAAGGSEPGAPPEKAGLAEGSRVPTFPQLFTGLVRDFSRLASKDHALILGFGAVTAVGSYRLDEPIAAADWGRGFVRQALEPGAIIGNTLTQSGAALATYAIGRALGKPRIAIVGADLFRAQLVAQGAVQAVKFSTQRTRPDGTRLSFPSGHTAAAFSTATVLHRDLGWKVGVAAYAASTMVAASRIQAGRHYLSDVIAGATVGILAGRSVTVGRGPAQFSLSPMAVPGGLGVTFVKIQ